MEQTTLVAEKKERRYLTAEDECTADQNNLVNVKLADGSELLHLEPRRLFPVSAPQNYITLLDEEGTEIAVIRKIADLSDASAEAIRRSLDDYYLVPTIRKLLKQEEKYGILRWTVLTERGEVSFDIRNRMHDIRRLPDGRIRVRDSNDNRYIINGEDSLDAHSRAMLIENM